MDRVHDGSELLSPGTAGSKNGPATSTPTSSSSRNTTTTSIEAENDATEEMYWRSRFLYWALESVLFRHEERKCGKHPQLTSDVMERLKLHFFIAIEDDGQDPLITPDVTNAVSALVDDELESMVKSVTKKCLRIVQGSKDVVDQEWYRKMVEAADPSEIALSMLEQKQQQILEFEELLERHRTNNTQQLIQFDDILNETKDELNNLVLSITGSKNSVALASQAEKLQFENQHLETELRRHKREIEDCANPPELEDETTRTFNELRSKRTELEQQLQATDKFLEEYASQPTEIKAALAKLQQLNEAIKRQQWMLHQLQKFDDVEGASGMNDSFANPSESSF